MSEGRFYDAHCHIMNLSHPNLLAFLERLNLPIIMLFAPLFPFLLQRNYRKLKNLLAVMENDLGTLLLMMERFLLEDKGLWENGRLKISGNRHSKIVLTPLLMDFGYKGRTDPGPLDHPKAGDRRRASETGGFKAVGVKGSPQRPETRGRRPSWRWFFAYKGFITTVQEWLWIKGARGSPRAVIDQSLMMSPTRKRIGIANCL